MTFVYKADPVRGARWAELFAERAPHIAFRLWPDVGDPAQVRYLATWIPPANVQETFPNLQVVFSVGAGVDQIDMGCVPAQVPIVRMIEPGITDRMVEYVTHAVLTIHRGFRAYDGLQAQRQWEPMPNRLASDIRVGVLGMGELAKAVLARLRMFDYRCAAWSRSQRRMEGVACFAGPNGLPELLAQSDILVCLLPLTNETHHLLNEDVLRQLPRGASLIQTGRGGHLDQVALLRLLDEGHLDTALLDVTDPEPLPFDHPLWLHPKVRITPHIASTTHPDSAVSAVLANLERLARGEALVGRVDKARGY